MSIKPHRGRRPAGTSLIELLVAMAIGALVTLATGGLSLYSGRSFAAMCNYVDMEIHSRNALDMMTRDVRQAVALRSFATNQLVFEDFDGADLTYSYSPTTKTLTRLKGGDSQVLLRGCDRLDFAIFQRNPLGGTYDFYPTASATTAKLIQVTWTCAREIFGTTVNTESVQMAKIVIRKKRVVSP